MTGRNREEREGAEQPIAQSPLERGKAVALRFLASRARTEAQVRARLEKAELSEVAGDVVAWLKKLGYVDDAAYARARARSLLHPGRAGPRLAERRLAASGIPAADARRAVKEATSESGEEALAREALARRARGQDLDDPKVRARLSRWLLARGFSGAVISKVLGVYLDIEAD